MLRKPDIYTTVNSSPLRGIQCPFLPTQVSHRDTAFLPSRHRSNILFHTPLCLQQACPACALHYSGQEFATAQSGSCPYKEVGAAAWDWGHPSLPVPTPPVQWEQLPRVSSANSPVSPKYQVTAFYSLHNSKLGEGGVVTGGGQKQKRLIKGGRGTGSFTHPPQTPRTASIR